MKNSNFFGGLFLVVAVTLLLRLPYVLLIPFLSVDEIFYALAAAVINSGGTLFVDFIDIRSPLLYYLYALVFRLVGTESIFAVQLLGVAWTLLTTAVLYRIARFLSNGRAAFLTAIFYAVYSTTFDPPDMTAANAELFMVLPLAAGALFFLRGLRNRSSRNYCLAGLFSGVGFLFKQPGIMDLGAMFLFLTSIALAGEITIREAGKRASLVLAGFLVPVAVIMAYFYSRGALGDLYFWSWAYGFKYSGGVPLLAGAQTTLLMLRKLTLPNFAFWIFVPISIFSLRKSKFKTGYAFCWFWGLFSLAGAVAGRRPWFHYYIQAIPPFAVLAGLGAAAALERSFALGKKSWWGVFLKAAIAVSLAASVFITHRVRRHDLEGMYGPGYRKFYSFKKVEHPGQRLADHIRQNTSESDLIYAWGYFPEIYALAGRRPASRFIVADLIVGKTPGGKSPPIFIPGVGESFMKDLESNRPAYFIDTSPRSGYYANQPARHYRSLRDYLDAYYEFETEIDRNLVYRRRRSY